MLIIVHNMYCGLQQWTTAAGNGALAPYPPYPLLSNATDSWISVTDNYAADNHCSPCW